MRTVPVFMGKKKESSRVLMTQKPDGKCMLIRIQSRNNAQSDWTAEYSRELGGWETAEIMTGYWEAINRYITVVYRVASDGCLDYIVLAKKRDTIGEILERKNIQCGALRLEAGKLIEAEGNRCFRWVNTGMRLILVKHKKLPIPDALRIEYSISKKGDIKVLQKVYLVKAGSIIQFVRTDDNPCIEKFLFNTSQAIRTFDQLYSFQIMDRCRAEFKIVPVGNEDKAEKIIIEVR